jgi:hypothetical protein
LELDYSSIRGGDSIIENGHQFKVGKSSARSYSSVRGGNQRIKSMTGSKKSVIRLTNNNDISRII